jgi:ribosomal protein L37AE/L43A
MKLKLKCPLCETEFITSNNEKIWCSKSCSNKNTQIKKNIEKNISKRKMCLDERFLYDFENDKIILKVFNILKTN